MICVSIRNGLGNDTYYTKKSVQHPRMSKLLLKHQNREVCLDINRDEWFFNYVYMCLHTSCERYKRCAYHSWMALVLILHKQVHLPPQNAWILAQKRKQGGTFGYKKRWAILQLCLPSVCTHHMRYIKDVSIIQEWPWCWYPTNRSIYWGGMFDYKKRLMTLY